MRLGRSLAEPEALDDGVEGRLGHALEKHAARIRRQENAGSGLKT
jgi:hypothetical protein